MESDVEIRQVEVRGGRTRVWLRAGRSPALVFLHYWGGSHRTFQPVIAKLSSECSLVTYDQRGWGTSRSLPGPFGISELADDAVNIVRQLGIQSFVLVGHSMGGKVAQIIASQQPRGLRGVVLIAPAPPNPTVDAHDAERRSHAYDNRTTIRQALDHALTYHPLPADLREQVLTDSLAGHRHAVRAWPLQGMHEDISDMVQQIHVPVHILAGKYDRVDPPDALTANLLPFIPTAQMTIVEETGHLSPLEAPDQIAAQIDHFIAHLESSQ